MLIIKSPRRQERHLPLVIDDLSGGGCVIWDGVPRTETEFIRSGVGITSQSWKEPEEIIRSASCFQIVNSKQLRGNYSCRGKNCPIQNIRKAFGHWPFFCQPHISHHVLLIVTQCFRQNDDRGDGVTSPEALTMRQEVFYLCYLSCPSQPHEVVYSSGIFTDEESEV